MYVERIELTADTDPPVWCKRIPGGFEITCDVEYGDICLGPRTGLNADEAGKYRLTRVEPQAEEAPWESQEI